MEFDDWHGVERPGEDLGLEEDHNHQSASEGEETGENEDDDDDLNGGEMMPIPDMFPSP